MRCHDTLILLLFAFNSCGNVAVPSPNLAAAEAPVRDKVESRRSAVLASPTAETWSDYARVLDVHGFSEDAEKAYLAAVELDASKAFDNLHLAGVVTLQIDLERARAHLVRALTLRKDYMATYLHLATIEERLGRFEKAREQYALVASRWKSGHALLGLGRAALRAGDAEGAISYLIEAQQLEPRHQGIYEALARAFARVGKPAESRAAAKRAGTLADTPWFVDPLAEKINDEDARAMTRFRHAYALLKEGQYTEAIKEFEAALQVQPGYIIPRYQLARAFALVGRVDDAYKQLGRILEKDSNNPEALEARARLFLAQKKWTEAERDLRALLKVAPDHPWARAQVGK